MERILADDNGLLVSRDLIDPDSGLDILLVHCILISLLVKLVYNSFKQLRPVHVNDILFEDSESFDIQRFFVIF